MASFLLAAPGEGGGLCGRSCRSWCATTVAAGKGPRDSGRYAGRTTGGRVRRKGGAPWKALLQVRRVAPPIFAASATLLLLLPGSTEQPHHLRVASLERGHFVFKNAYGARESLYLRRQERA